MRKLYKYLAVILAGLAIVLLVAMRLISEPVSEPSVSVTTIEAPRPAVTVAPAAQASSPATSEQAQALPAPGTTAAITASSTSSVTTPEGPTQAWKALGPSGVQPYKPEWDDFQRYAQPVQVDTQALHQLEVGAELIFPVPQLNRRVRAVVDYVEERDGGRRLLRGSTEHGRPYSFVITLGRSMNFATMTTLQGVYELEWVGELGWIIAQRDRDILPIAEDEHHHE